MKNTLLPLLLLSIPAIAPAVPVNVALNRPAVADSIYSPAYTPDRAVDGDSTSDTSRWLSADSAMPHWIEVELGQTYALSQMKFWTGKNGQPPLVINDFALQHWDGTGWTDLYSETASTNTGAVDVSFGPAVSGNRVRLYATAGTDNIVRLFEIEIYGEPHTLTYSSLEPALGETTVDHSGDIVITFNAPVSTVTTSGIRVENLDTATDLAGISASVSGNQLWISHPGLSENSGYAVHVPAGAVALAADGSQLNGPIYWTFETAPFVPQLSGYTSEIPGLTDDVELVFDRPLNIVNPAGIRFERFSDGIPVSGTSVSLSGDTLTFTHDPLVFEETYLVIIEADTLEGVLNGQGNEEIRALVYAGSTVIFSTNFDTGLEGFETGHTLGEIVGTSSNIYWRWVNTGTGPNYDSFYLRSSTNYYDDFVLSPQVNLRAGRTYTIEFKASLARSLHVGVTPSANLSDVEEIALISTGNNKSVRLEYTATDTAPEYFIFYTGETNNWQTQLLDAMTLTESVPPLVRINTPLAGGSFLESDSIPVEIEAYGISGELTTLEIYDNDVLRVSIPATESLYTYDWTYHAPGEHTLRVKVTDARGNTSEDEVTLTVTFDDGTLPPYIGWDFDDSSQGWEFTIGLSWYVDRVRVATAGQLALSSPEVFLYAGESYTVQFKARTWGTTNTFDWAFLVTDGPGFPVDDTGRSNFNINSATWAVYEIPFTVPTDGPYHLTQFETNSSYNKVEFDDIRLIGNFNSVPQVEITSPASSIQTIAGADLLFEANPADFDGTVVSVEFRDANSGELLEPGAVLNSSPWNYLWSDLADGEYRVFARVIDNANGVGDSAPVTISVAPNLISMSTYLGGADTDENLTGAVYLSDGTLVLGGIIDPALFPGVTPLYLNGSTAGDRGVVARLSEDGTTVLSVTVVGSKVVDLDTDGSDRIFVAAMADGALVLNAGADTVLWSDTFAAPYAHRIDAADGGTFAVLTSSQADYRESKVNSGSNYVYSSAFVPLGVTAGASAFTTDLAVDEASQTLVLIGWKNVASMQDDSSGGSNPVDVPAILGRAYDGTTKWRAYDWGKEEDGDRWLNLYTNNMADTRGARIIVHEGRIYAGIEFDGGNTPLRYDPFDLAIPASVVGGDQYHSMYNTSTVPKTFIGIYDAATGAYQNGQWITNRLPDDSDNTIRIERGNILVDTAGRIHVVGACAAGLPMTHDPFPGAYSGGGYHLVYSPDFTSREFVTRLGIKGDNAAIALSPGGRIAISGTIENALFLKNAFQSTLTNSFDAYYTVAEYEDYYNFQSGSHPRLFFDDTELATVRARLGDEPYASMLAYLIAQRDFGEFYRPYDPANEGNLMQRAQASSFIYALTGDEVYATDARTDIESAYALIGDDWASASVKGLTLYARATKLATAYDLCANSDAWDAGFNYEASRRLVEIAEIIDSSGGTEQPSGLGSNWAAARGSSAGIALLASDHAYDPAVLDSSHTRTINYLNANQGGGATRGWNPEGFGYTAYAIGSFLGPYAIAAKRFEGAYDLTGHTGLQWMPWTGFAGATTALDVYGLGGVKTDWADDNAHVGGEGIYGMAFAFAPESLKPGLKHAYDRFMGGLAPFGEEWDGVRAGTFWSILYYPADTIPQDPTEIWDWHRGSDDSGGIGVFTFRNEYQDSDDILVQLKARLRTATGAHDGPDGLGFRIIGLGDPFAVGGGRNLDLGELNQATVYPSNPNNDVSRNTNTGALAGTPLLRPDGGGHVIASMATNNVGTSSHKRWLVTDYDSASTGADAVIIVADTTSNGVYWQLPTFLNNSITTSGNTFTITGTNGATLKGTILHPGGSPSITVGTKARGDGYTLSNGGTLATEDPVTNPRVTENRYLFIQDGGDGDFLVVMTMQKTGAHPAVTHVSGTVADAVVQVGNRNYALQPSDVLYSTGTNTPVAYVAPNATVNFDADGKGTLGGAAVQSVPYGGSAIAPVVSPDSGYTFMGWNKTFTQVVKSMTVTALYDAIASGFGQWISDALYGLDPADQDPGDNPDFDPYNNLMEYALVLNPSLPDGAGVITVREESGNLILSYRVRDRATDITVTPKYASDLSGSWTDIPGANISLTGSGPNYTEYEASTPIGSGPLFLILEVTQ